MMGGQMINQARRRVADPMMLCGIILWQSPSFNTRSIARAHLTLFSAAGTG
jgi:hypothetical protein